VEYGRGWPRPAISNAEATAVAAQGAILNSVLESAGAAPAHVFVCYSASRAGTTNVASWDTVADAGLQEAGPVGVPVNGLQSVTTYYYRFFATNDYGEDWGTDTARVFKTAFDFGTHYGTNYVGRNMNFETNSGPDMAWFGSGGDWVSFAGGNPCDGNLMLTLAGSDGVDIDAYQRVDLSYYREAFANTNVTFEASIGVNFVGTTANNFQFWLDFYQGNTLLLETVREKHVINADPADWERVSVPSGTVPAAADRADIHLRVEGGAPWAGYFLDCAEFTIFIPGTPPPLNGSTLIVW